MVSTRNAVGGNTSRDKKPAGNSRSRQGFSRTSVGNSSKRNANSSATSASGAQMQIFVNGKNMTPQPLMKQTSSSVAADEKPQIRAPMLAKAQPPVEHAVVSASAQGSPTKTPAYDGEPTSAKKLESGSSLGRHASFKRGMSTMPAEHRASMRMQRDEAAVKLPPGVTLEDLEKPVTLTLTESATEVLFDLKAICVASDFPGVEKITAANAAYQALCDSRSNSDRFTARSAQTINLPSKDKQVMASPAATREVGCHATAWGIFDDLKSEEVTKGEDGDLPATPTAAGNSGEGLGPGPRAGAANHKGIARLRKQVNDTVQVALSSPGCLINVDEAKAPAQNGFSGASVTSQMKDLPATQQAAGTSAAAPESAEQILAAQQAKRILESHELVNSLQIVERAVMQGLYKDMQLKYREEPAAASPAGLAEGAETGKSGVDLLAVDHVDEALPPAAAATPPAGEATDAGSAPEDPAAGASPSSPEARVGDAASGSASVTGTTPSRHGGEPSLVQLFEFKCDFTEGRNVSSMAWNKVNKDVLAVGYGEFNFKGQESGGMVLFWSLRNPEYPERVIQVPSGVTALDFSMRAPHLLAVGTYDGGVAIYNLRKDTDVSTPVLDSSSLPGKHMDPVWQLKWVDKGPERGEVLVSISTDGRVAEWSMKKGLSCTTLMVLKRVGATDGIISRQASGLTFDFSTVDSSMYFAGTEDGSIHRCSCSYNEQFLDTYSGHTGPVYRIRSSPFWSSAFLSCSADWTVKLWNTMEQEERLEFHSVDLTDVVHDVAWSPTSSTIFGSVAGDGRLEIWDLSQSLLDPAIRIYPEEPRADPASDREPTHHPAQTSVLFSDNSPVVAVGSSTGSARIYRIAGLDVRPALGTEAQIERLRSAMYQ